MEGSEGLVLVPAESSMKLLQVEKVRITGAAKKIPSGELTVCNGKSQFLMENPLFLWPCSIAILV